MKGKLLKKLTAIVLVLCMTATNFIFVASNAVYALSGTAELGERNIVFKAYFKDNNQELIQKTANISEGDKLYVGLEVKAGKLEDAKIKIKDANFQIDEEKVDKKYIKNIDTKNSEIALKTIGYTDGKDGKIEIELPIKFQEADKISTSYFDMENKISLSGNYFNSSENGTYVEGEVQTKLIWSEKNISIEWKPSIEKIVYFNNKTLVQAKIESLYSGGYFPKETEKLTINKPKVNDITPSYTVLVDGDKIDANSITDSVADNNITITNNLKNDNQITWKNTGNVYKVIYVYDGLKSLEDPIELKATVETKLFNRDALKSKTLNFNSNVPKGAIATVTAQDLSKEVYKGYMYANSEQTTYSEKYNMEISHKDGVTATLEYAEDALKTQNGEKLSTNSKTVYKELKINKAKLAKVLGNSGTLKITFDNTELSLNSSSTDDGKGNIVIDKDRINDSHTIKMEVISAANEGTIEVTANKAIVGNAGYDKETLKSINALETTIKAYTNYEKEATTATATTELKETTTEATLTMNNNNILSTSKTNEVEFVASLRTGTMDTDLLKEPTIKVLLPQDVTKVELTSVSALYADNQLQIAKSEVIEENGIKEILVKLDGEQINYNNKFIEGIKITINAKISVNEMASSKDTQIEMKYTNENSAQTEYSAKIPVSIQAKYGLITKSQIIENNGKQILRATVLNNHDKTIENIALIGNMPAQAIAKENVEVSIQNANIQIQYSKDGNKWEDTAEGAKYFKVRLLDSKLASGEKFAISVTMDVTKTILNFKFAYLYETKENTQDLVIDEIVSDKEETTEDENKQEQEGKQTNTDKLSIKMVADYSEEVYEGQTIRYTYTIKNNTKNNIENVKLKANHENGNVFEYETDEQVNTAKPVENLKFTFEKEQDKSNTQIDIGTIKPDETKKVSYQVRVKENVKEIKTNAEVSADGIETVKIEDTKAVKEGKLKLDISTETARENILTAGKVNGNKLIIKNISDENLKDITVVAQIPQGFEFYELYDKGSSNNYSIIQKDAKQVIFKINQLNSKVTETFMLTLKTLNVEKELTQTIKYNATIDNETYNSNEVTVRIQPKVYSQIEAQITTNMGEIVKTDDNLTYKITIKNTSANNDIITVTDVVPEAAVVTNAYYTVGEKTTKIENIEDNIVLSTFNINANQEAYLTIETKIDESETGKEEIANYATIVGQHLEKAVTTETIKNKLQANIKEDNSSEQENSEEETKTDAPSTEGKIDVKGSISGLAWIDSNKNGIREDSEKALSGVKVAIADVETGKYITDEKGNKTEVTTNESGEYKFENISNGKYIIIFEYDNTKYRNTQYQVKDATETTNSDIITSKLSSSNDDIKYGITDTLELKEESLEHIDAGFIENEIFDLSLTKTVSKVIVQNSSGTTVKEYTNEQLAKLELDAKNLAGSTLLVEYKIQVKNEGEIAGYANEIIDYMPRDLTFNSEMNKDWYVSTDGNAHTTALSKELINPEETKTVTLTLVKTMTENNTGLTSNKAEIAKSSNELSIPDKDSKAGNNTQGEDDISTAELIVSVRTGIEFTIGIIIALIALGTTGIIVYTKVRKGAKHE